MQSYSKSQPALVFQALLGHRNCIRSHLLSYGSEIALALEHLPSMAWKKQHWPAMDKSTCCTWIVTIQVLSLARAATLTVSVPSQRYCPDDEPSQIICCFALADFKPLQVWPWPRQWLLSCTCFLKHTGREALTQAEHTDPLLSLHYKRSPTVLTGNGHMGGCLLQGTSQEMRYCRPQCNPKGAKTWQEVAPMSW